MVHNRRAKAFVIPAKAGIQIIFENEMDSVFRRNDNRREFSHSHIVFSLKKIFLKRVKV